jgi:hypothetical protein
MREMFAKLKPNQDISRAVTIKLSQSDIEKLPASSRVLGCNPSLNVYGYEPISVDPVDYPYRSAGGHIHFGTQDNNAGNKLKAVLRDTETTVRLLDAICGNTCVLIDRDRGNKKRREVYGRAGEHRLPDHGLEYRTLSNFWVFDYVLVSFVMGLARQAIHIAYESYYRNKEGVRVQGRNYAQELLSLLNEQDVRDAINNNDKKLALKNFKIVSQYLLSINTTETRTDYYDSDYDDEEDNEEYDAYDANDWVINKVEYEKLQSFLRNPATEMFDGTARHRWLNKYSWSGGLNNYLLHYF